MHHRLGRRERRVEFGREELVDAVPDDRGDGERGRRAVSRPRRAPARRAATGAPCPRRTPRHPPPGPPSRRARPRRGAGCRRAARRRAPTRGTRAARCADCPATDTSSFAVPNSRAKSGRLTLMPWMRSSRALRCERNRMPLRTSTASCVMRKVCMRHDSQKPMMTRDDEQRDAGDRPADEPVRRRCRRSGRSPSRPATSRNATSMSSPRSGAKSTRNMSTSALAEVRDDEAEHGDEARGRRAAADSPGAAGATRRRRGS